MVGIVKPACLQLRAKDEAFRGIRPTVYLRPVHNVFCALPLAGFPYGLEVGSPEKSLLGCDSSTPQAKLDEDSSESAAKADTEARLANSRGRDHSPKLGGPAVKLYAGDRTTERSQARAVLGVRRRATYQGRAIVLAGGGGIDGKDGGLPVFIRPGQINGEPLRDGSQNLLAGLDSTA